MIANVPPLPDRTLLVSTEVSGGNKASVKVTSWVPAMEHPFVLEESAYMVKLPNIVYSLKYDVTDESFSDLRIAVTTDKTVTVDSKLYRWPWSNVFGHTGVCWKRQNGKCALTDVPQKAVGEFLSTPNNRDLWGVSSSYNGPRMTYEEFLTKTQSGVNPDWLIPLNKTVTEFHNN